VVNFTPPAAGESFRDEGERDPVMEAVLNRFVEACRTGEPLRTSDNGVRRYPA